MIDNQKTINLEIYKHSMAHVMAAAVKKICPDAKLGIGPSISEGFYYDFLLPEGFAFTSDILKQIKKEMKSFMKKGHIFNKSDLSIEEAKNFFKDEEFKIDLIEELQEKGNDTVSNYTSGEFVDLCSGPHVENSKQLFKLAWRLDRVSGAYWRGSEKYPMLQRIYALCFETKDELNDYIHRREEAMKRDHRKLGKELDYFIYSDLVGKGLPLLLPKGATLKRILERFIIDEELKRGYQHVHTPPLGRRKLYEVSGHWEHYQDSMYPPMTISDEDFVLRPMTCPHHFMIYSQKPRSYRELPMRLAEMSPLFRKEQSGELSGLIRILMFTLADAHIICTLDHLADEFKSVIELIDYIMNCLGINDAISFQASLRDDNKEKYVDNDEMWNLGEDMLLKIMDEINVDYVVSKGDAAFYGPKLDVQMKNVLGKEETLFTVQIDFSLPDRFDLTYIDDEDNRKRPVIIHRSSIGCIERTIAFLLEYYGGSLPMWLSPVQAKILTVSDKFISYAEDVEKMMLKNNIRVEKDIRSETIGKKIREGRLQRIPYLIIIGGKEAEEKSLTLRNRDTGNQGCISLETALLRLKRENEEYILKLEADKEE